MLSLLVTIFSGGTVTDILLGAFMVFAFIAVIFVSYTMTQRAFRLILSFVCLMSPYCLLVALVQRALGMEWVYGARYNSIFTNPNDYAFYISLVVLFCIYNIVKSEDTPLRGVYAALIPLNLIALELTECRTTFMVLLIVCPVMLWFCGKKEWLSYLFTMLGILLTLVLFGESLDFLPRIDLIRHDFAKRMSIWSGAIGSIMDAPWFGRGYNTYERIRRPLRLATASQNIRTTCFWNSSWTSDLWVRRSYSVTLPSMSARLSACTRLASATSATPSRSPSSFAFGCTGFWISPCCGRKPVCSSFTSSASAPSTTSSTSSAQTAATRFCAARKIHSGKEPIL